MVSRDARGRVAAWLLEEWALQACSPPPHPDAQLSRDPDAHAVVSCKVLAKTKSSRIHVPQVQPIGLRPWMI